MDWYNCQGYEEWQIWRTQAAQEWQLDASVLEKGGETPKPRYMRWAKYDVLMEEYRRLQKEYETMYNESLMI